MIDGSKLQILVHNYSLYKQIFCCGIKTLFIYAQLWVHVKDEIIYHQFVPLKVNLFRKDSVITLHISLQYHIAYKYIIDICYQDSKLHVFKLLWSFPMLTIVFILDTLITVGLKNHKLSCNCCSTISRKPTHSICMAKYSKVNFNFCPYPL